VVVRKSPRQSRSREKVLDILGAAKQLLATEGLERLTTNRIAKIAGMSIGSLYQYFPNKQAIIHQLYSDWLASVRELLREHQESDLRDQTPAGIMQTMMERIYCPDDLDPVTSRYETELNKAMHLYPELQTIEHEHARQIASILADIFRRTGVVADEDILFQLGLYSYELYTSYEAMLLHEGTSPRLIYEWQKQGLFSVLASYTPGLATT
jgi:AcrR family transcriptional regulator